MDKYKMAWKEYRAKVKLAIKEYFEKRHTLWREYREKIEALDATHVQFMREAQEEMRQKRGRDG